VVSQLWAGAKSGRTTAVDWSICEGRDRHGHIVVDLRQRWPEWLALARSADIRLLPVLEALPLEEWYAVRQTVLAQEMKAAIPDPASVEGAGESLPDPVGGNGIDGDDDDGDSFEGEGDGHGVPLADPTMSGLHPVSASALLQHAPGLIRDCLQPWLRASGLDPAEHAVVVMDARASQARKELGDCVEFLPSNGGTDLTAAQLSRLRGSFDALGIQREDAPNDCAAMEEFFVRHWQRAGKDKVRAFTPEQRVAMDAICARESDVLVALPTGGGKSALFQVPGLCRGLRNRRLTLVISPLRALMGDQVEELRRQGFAESADYLSGDRPPYETAEVLQGLLDHRIVLLYVAPERLRSEMFLAVLRQRMAADDGLEYVVVDETHCVNQWGFEFRPDYFHALGLLLKELRSQGTGAPTPFLMVSATITVADREVLRGMLAGAAVPGRKPFPVHVLPKEFQHPLRAHIEVRPMPMQGRINDRKTFDLVVLPRLSLIDGAIAQAQSNQRATHQRSAVVIFVAQRRQAERLAHLLGAKWGPQVDYFHAGLDAISREEVYRRFRDQKLDVLVATKAFGMGMNIPDIHWAIHLGPPAYLEDYLQEVGRVGRDDAMRAKAGLKQVEALLLCSPEDFDGIRQQRARSAVQLPFIQEHYDAICAQAYTVDNQWMAVIPEDGFAPSVDAAQRRVMATRIRMALHWLQRAGLLELCATVPNLLPVKLDVVKLRLISRAGGKQGALAGVILDLEEPRQHHADVGRSTAPSGAADMPQVAGGWLGRAMLRLGEMVGFLLGHHAPVAPSELQPPAPASAPSPTAQMSTGDAVLNLGSIMARCELTSLSEVMEQMARLTEQGALEMRRSFPFAERHLTRYPPDLIDTLFDAVERASAALVGQMGDSGRHEFSEADLMVDGVAISGLAPKDGPLFDQAFVWGVIRLLKASGLRIRQVAGDEHRVIYEATIPPAARGWVGQHRQTTVAVAKAVLALLQRKLSTKTDVVSMAELINTARAAVPGQRFREASLKQALSLLAALRLASLTVELTPMSHVVSLRQLGAPLDAPGLQSVWEELGQINLLAALRNSAMEVFANLPREAQAGFMQGYFAQGDAAGLEVFLDQWLGEMDATGDLALSNFIASKREQLRATKVQEFFDRYEQSPEPGQWAAICHPYEQHLLVNAGPGSGKTSVLVGRIVHLIRKQGVLPSEIVVLAFNRAVVFEIKRRVRALFQTLGYGAHVRAVRISTFHGLATRSMADVSDADGRHASINNLLPAFAHRLQTEARFRQQVATGCRAILVDEFQDATDDVYEIIRQLHAGTGGKAGVMVIGDDDQDILRWNRQNKNFSEQYFERFIREFGGDSLRRIDLAVNFRSGMQIVDESQTAIKAFFGRGGPSHRIKDFVLRAAPGAATASTTRRDGRGLSWDGALHEVEHICRQHAQAGGGSLAILCRSNAEVVRVYRRLRPVLPNLQVQGSVRYRVADLRHVALWLDYLDEQLHVQDRALTTELQDQLEQVFRSRAPIPEVLQAHRDDVALSDLWRLCLEERSYPHLSDLIAFVRDLRRDDLGRMLGDVDDSRAVVATVHKAKGLEFDTVVVMPSESAFPFDYKADEDEDDQGDRRLGDGKSRPDFAMDAAEEARLLYVAMTRAKRHLVRFVGGRERAWQQPLPIPQLGRGPSGVVLAGLHKEVVLSWAMTLHGFNPDPEATQFYIERHVRIGDKVNLAGWGAGAGRVLMHQGPDGRQKQIGFLAKKSGAGMLGEVLRVSAVIRYLADSERIDFWTKLPSFVQKRGWGYAVLVAGQL
jgi:superfamily II DNA helicase RecQ